MFHQALGFFDDHFRHLDVAGGRLVEGRGDHLAVDRALHIGDLLGALIDQQHDQVNLGVIGGDGVGNVLQQHGFAGTRRRHDQGSLPLADRGNQIDHPGRKIVRGSLEDEALLGIEGRQVVEQSLFPSDGGILEIDLGDLEQGEIAFALLRRPDLPGNRVAGAQVETPDLGG